MAKWCNYTPPIFVNFTDWLESGCNETGKELKPLTGIKTSDLLDKYEPVKNAFHASLRIGVSDRNSKRGCNQLSKTKVNYLFLRLPQGIV